MTERVNSEYDDGDSAELGPLDAHDRDLDALCESWVIWCRSHRLYSAAPPEAAAIAKLGGNTRPLPILPEYAVGTASLAAFHIAYTCQPNSLEKKVFDLYYIARVKPIKTAAAALGIGRARFYKVLANFRVRLERAAKAVEGNPINHALVRYVNAESVSKSGDTLDNP